MARTTVTDPAGVTWTVRRWWWRTVPWETGLASLDALIFVLVLPFMLAWPVWLAAKWFGVSWTVLVEQDGEKVVKERVRGWGRSGQRMSELAQAAQAGELSHLVVEEP